MRLALVAGLLLFAATAAAQPGTASYSVRFDATWTAVTHPQNYPPNPHFSGLVGGTHDGTVVFWSAEELASLGIQRMAEWGTQVDLVAEVDAAILAGSAEHVITASPLWTVPGSLSQTFTIGETHSRVTLVSMLAPSPDWFVGVQGLDLRPGGAWVEELVVELYPWDAGTDSGVSYTSADLATVPPEPIALVDGAPFSPGVPVGTFTFTRVAVASVPLAADLAVRAWPNPFNPRTTIAWELPAEGRLLVEVFDLAGRRVRILRDGPAPAGTGRAVWDGRDGAGRIMPAAPYLVTVESAGRRARRTVTLLK